MKFYDFEENKGYPGSRCEICKKLSTVYLKGLIYCCKKCIMIEEDEKAKQKNTLINLK